MKIKAVIAVFGLVCGAVVGSGLGLVAAAAIGFLSRLIHPNDPSAGSAAIVVIFTAPLGAIAGAVAGVLTANRRPRLFCATLLPLAMLFVALQIASSTLRRMDRPRNFELNVRGTPGAEFVGLVAVDDGVAERRKGTLPASFTFIGSRIEAAFALVDLDRQEEIVVNVAANGNDLETGTATETGVYQLLKSVGYSETFGGTSTFWHRMSVAEVHALIKDELMPRTAWEPYND